MSINGVGNTPPPNYLKELGTDKAMQGSVSNFTESIFTGEKINVGEELKNMGKNIIKNATQKALSNIKSLLVGALKRLFIGNDNANAVSDKAGTATKIGKSAAEITATQAKLLDTGLQALIGLAQTGEININQLAAGIKDSVKLIEDKNAAAGSLTEQKTELEERNAEILDRLQELGVEMEPEESGETQAEQTMIVTEKDENGKEIKKEVKIGGSENNQQGTSSNMSPEVTELLEEYQNNLGIIQTFAAEITNIATETTEIVTNTTESQVNLETESNTLAENILTETQEIGNEVKSGITNVVSKNNSGLETDVTKSVTEGGVDVGTAAAAPGIAAATTAGTLGMGSAAGANILKNGVQDGIAAGIRGITGSSAAGGMVANLMSEQSLGVAATNVLITEANNQASKIVNELTSGLKIGELDVGALIAPEITGALEIEQVKENVV